MASPNAEYIDVWNEILVPRFIRYRGTFVAGSAPHSGAALARQPVPEGARVLDVGCGFGETTLEIARAVGPRGRVLGLDVCEPFLAIARADAAAAGVAWAEFREGDAQTTRFEETRAGEDELRSSEPIVGGSEPVSGFRGKFDVCFSRFGTMFFANPVAALRNLRRAVAPGGRLTMSVWRRVEENSFADLPRKVARRFIPPPPEQAPSCSPGPFSMGDPDVLQAQLAGAGWTDVALDRVDADFTVGATIDDAVGYMLTLGPAGRILLDAGPEGEARRPEIAAALAERLVPFVTPAGVVLTGSSWCVTARAPLAAG